MTIQVRYHNGKGRPRTYNGDVSSYRARAKLWRSVAEDLEAQAKVMA